MTLLMNPVEVTEELHETYNGDHSTPKENNLTIVTKTTINHSNPMPEASRLKTRNEAQDMSQLFRDTLKEKGEYHSENFKWFSENEVEVSNLSQMSLHSFLLEAEALGKNVHFIKQTVIKIED